MSDRDNERHRQRYAEDPGYRQRIRASGKAWRRANKNRINAARRLRWATDPKYRKKRMKQIWAVNLKLKYGMTVEDYDRMFKKQKGRCAICKKKSRRRRLQVDHDHRKKYVRRLLCHLCNKGLGIFKDNSRLLRCAGAYIDECAKEYRDRNKRGRGAKKGRAGSKRKR
jgi:hypothetical protein